MCSKFVNTIWTTYSLTWRSRCYGSSTSRLYWYPAWQQYFCPSEPWNQVWQYVQIGDRRTSKQLVMIRYVLENCAPAWWCAQDSQIKAETAITITARLTCVTRRATRYRHQYQKGLCIFMVRQSPKLSHQSYDHLSHVTTPEKVSFLQRSSLGQLFYVSGGIWIRKFKDSKTH